MRSFAPAALKWLPECIWNKKTEITLSLFKSERVIFMVSSYWSGEENLLQFLRPEGVDGVGRHPPITSRAERNGSDLWTIRETGTLKLLVEEAAIEIL